MCGILGGYWRRLDDPTRRRIDSAMQALHHRGPDDLGKDYQSTTGGDVFLGHTRLSIIDLSSAGHQPMATDCGRFTITYNGEIYNYRVLREELAQKGHEFQSDSDTEVLLKAWSEWGQSCLERLIGMFAFVVYDRLKEELWCARDAFGIKPLFYVRTERGFIFSSEVPALLLLDPSQSVPDLQKSYDYLVHGEYDCDERTFFKDVKQLLPGAVLRVSLSDLSQEKKRWWEPDARQDSSKTYEESVEIVRESFLESVRLHLISDVPVGAALSGGIDSSAVVCAMRHLYPDLELKTFSFISDDARTSEEEWVDVVNRHVSATPHKLRATGGDLLRDLDDMLVAQGEPFGSTSIYAQYVVYREAKRAGVTVTLDGQGADELLAGYLGYPAQRFRSLVEGRQFAQALRFLRNWSRWPGRGYRLLALQLGQDLLPASQYRMARRWLGRDFRPDWLDCDLMEEEGVVFEGSRLDARAGLPERRVVGRMINALTVRGLPALLRHGDRNAMRFSVESRVPFLSLDLARTLLSQPEHHLISPTGETKSIFRAAMRGIVPDAILDRKDKIGFATPEERWLKEAAPTLRKWLAASENIPFLNHRELMTAFDEMIAGNVRFNWQAWRWVNFVRWYERMVA